MKNDDFKEFFHDKFVAGEEFPTEPFQIVLKNREYARKYALPIHKMLTVTNVRYSIKEKKIRYSLLGAFFDFPWDSKSCEILETYSSN